jgi:predicted metal-dependent peptidase
MSGASDKIQRCAAKMLLGWPWWASLFLHCKQVETNAVATMAVDGTHLFFNPDFTLSLTDAECLGVLLHETSHLALLHPFRRRHRDPTLWNVAADAAANALLAADNILLPQGAVPPAPLDLTAEEIYDSLGEGLKGMAKSIAQDVLDPGGDGGMDGGMDEREWRDALAASRGLLPGGLERALGHATETRRDWREELSRFMHATSKGDRHTWSRVSRRIAGMPGWKRQPEATIAICIDTSGSIDHSTLSRFLGEVRGVANLAGITLYVISCDAAVTAVVRPGERLPGSFLGGGGTDFRPAVAAALAFLPDAIVYFTDGDGAFPSECPVPMLWALTKHAAVPFGETIQLNNGGENDTDE